MAKMAYRYCFNTDADFAEALNTFDLTVVAAEAIYGEARVRLELRFASKPETRRIAIRCDNEVGTAANLLFTKLSTVEFGMDSFTIDSIEEQEADSAT